MIINKLRTFVTALQDIEELTEEVDMQESSKPTCDTPGCFAGLVSRLPIPELKELGPEDYDYAQWGNALAIYLGFQYRKHLEDWAEENPVLWGNNSGDGMFTHGNAYGKDYDIFDHCVIVDHWKAVLKRVEENENK